MNALASDDAVMARWNDWINHQWADLRYLCQQREIVHETIAALDSKGENYVFANMLFQMYVRYQSIGVRRLTDRGSDTHSLRRLMEDALTRRHLLARDPFVQAHVDSGADPVLAAQLASAHYDDLWGPGTVEPSERAIREEIKRLEKRTVAVRKVTNRTQAHMANQKPDPLTLGELEQAVDELVEQFQRWAMVVTRTHREVDQVGVPDWREPLRSALF